MSSRLAVELANRFRTTEELREIQHEFLKRGTLVELTEVKRQVDKHLERILSETAFLHLSGFHNNVPNLAHLIVQKAWHVAVCIFDRGDIDQIDVYTAQCGKPSSLRRGSYEQMVRINCKEDGNLRDTKTVPEEESAIVLNPGCENGTIRGDEPAIIAWAERGVCRPRIG